MDLGISPIFSAMVNEARKSIRIMASYKINFLFGMVAIAISFLGISYVVGGGKPNPDVMASMLVGYLLWYYVTMIVDDMGATLIDEARAGTLEQMFISPNPIGFTFVGRVLGHLFLSSIQLLFVGGILIWSLKLPFQWSLDAIPVAMIALFGLFGFGFMLGGVSLIFKQVTSMLWVISNGLLFLNGSLVPAEQFPAWLLLIARILPSTIGISVLRSMLLNRLTISDVWNNGSLPLLLLHSTAYLVVGWLMLQWCIGYVKRHGTLGHY